MVLEREMEREIGGGEIKEKEKKESGREIGEGKRGRRDEEIEKE